MLMEIINKVGGLVEEMNDEQYIAFRGLADDWYEGRIDEEELEKILIEKYGITFAEYFEYFDED